MRVRSCAGTDAQLCSAAGGRLPFAPPCRIPTLPPLPSSFRTASSPPTSTRTTIPSCAGSLRCCTARARLSRTSGGSEEPTSFSSLVAFYIFSLVFCCWNGGWVGGWVGGRLGFVGQTVLEAHNPPALRAAMLCAFACLEGKPCSDPDPPPPPPPPPPGPAPPSLPPNCSYAVYSPLDGQPCADHDRATGEGVGPQVAACGRLGAEAAGDGRGPLGCLAVRCIWWGCWIDVTNRTNRLFSRRFPNRSGVHPDQDAGAGAQGQAGGAGG